MRGRYDLVVLGGGAAGLVASVTAAELGARVALIERDRPGGDCLYTGCVPSKSLIASAKLAHAIRTGDRLGLDAVEPRFEFARVMERIETVIAAAGERDSPEYLTARGVEVIRGHARFEEAGVVAVDGRAMRYRAALIATGSEPATPPIAGLDAAAALTNETIFALRERPQRLAVLGGGPIGVELGQALQRLGSRVTIVEQGGSPLAREEPEAGRHMTRVLESEGVRVELGTVAKLVRPTEGGAGTLVVEGLCGETELPYDRLLVATGRRPAAGALGLERVGVETTDAGWIRVDRRLRTTGDRIYAAGDAVGELFFTHVAGLHGLTAATNALFRLRRTVDHASVPWVTFTDPEVARVGMTELQARERLGRDPVVLRYDYADSDRALTAATASGFVKLVADRRGRLLGGTIVATGAGETIAEVTRVVSDGGKVGTLAQTLRAYPTMSEGPRDAATEWWRRRAPAARRVTRPLLAALRVVDRPGR